MTFQLRVFCRRPARQGRLLRVHAATKDGRCVSCMRVPQQRRSLSAPNLHPCRVSFSAEVATAFTDAFLALQLCLTSRISSQQFNAHTFLEQGASFQVKRGMQRVQDQRQMPALVKSSFAEERLLVLQCTEAIQFEEVWGKCLHCFAQPVLSCQHDVEHFKHDSSLGQVLSSPAVLQL